MRTYLKKMRENKGLSQKEMAEAVNISQQYYGFIELSQRQQKMTLDMMLKLAAALNVSVNEIIENERKMVS